MADLSRETILQTSEGHQLIAGIDEAGRGAWAGPVVAGAVILPLAVPEHLAQLAEVNDSKQVTARQRERFYELIATYALAWGVGVVPAEVIDAEGIMAATRQAMGLAVAQLSPAPTYLLLDGRVRLTAVNLPQESIIRGDSLSLSIAAASIMAKVTRDHLMVALDGEYPGYGLGQHKGYGTAVHLHALQTHGPTPMHRYSFAPLRGGLLTAEARSEK
jgi:ribonuclease HII